MPRNHYTGSVQVMEWSSSGHSGPPAVQDGIDLLDYLAHYPSTARFLAQKLCVRFVSDAPPAELVESAAQVYLDHDTQIVPLLRHIFQSDAFMNSAGQKFRRPSTGRRSGRPLSLSVSVSGRSGNPAGTCSPLRAGLPGPGRALAAGLRPTPAHPSASGSSSIALTNQSNAWQNCLYRAARG